MRAPVRTQAPEGIRKSAAASRMGTLADLATFIIPSRATAELALDNYAQEYENGNILPGGTARSSYATKILSKPGVANAIAARIQSPAGKKYMDALVGSQLGRNHWYTPIASKLIGATSIGRGVVANKFMETMLPKVNGSTDTAAMFRNAGGQVI